MRQSDLDLRWLRAQRRGLGFNRRRHTNHASVHWRGSRDSLSKTVKPAKDYTWTQLDEDGDMIDIPHRQNPPRNPLYHNNPHYYNDLPCCQPSHDRLNHDLQPLIATIDQQTDLILPVLSAIKRPLQTPMGAPTISLSALMPCLGQPWSLDVFASDDIFNCLNNYTAECELYGVKVVHCAIHFPRYQHLRVGGVG
jgi:hypothetical protein